MYILFLWAAVGAGGPPGAGAPPGAPPPGGGGDLGGLPESRAKLENLLLESNDDDFIIKNSSLGDIENELLKILKDWYIYN